MTAGADELEVIDNFVYLKEYDKILHCKATIVYLSNHFILIHLN